MNKLKIFYIVLGMVILGWILSVLRWEMPKRQSDPDMVPGRITVTVDEETDVRRLGDFLKEVDKGLQIIEVNSSGADLANLVLVDYEEVWKPKMNEFFGARDKSAAEMQELSRELNTKKIQVMNMSKEIEEMPFVERASANERSDTKEYVPRIYVYFVDGQMDGYIEQILRQFPQLKLVYKNEKDWYVKVRVPGGREKEWAERVKALQFVKLAGPDYQRNEGGDI